MSLPRFLVFDALGAFAWSACYTVLGYLFKDQLDRVAMYAARIGEVIAFAGGMWLATLIIRKLVRWFLFLREFRLSRITPDELRDKLSNSGRLLLLDLQGSSALGQRVVAIPGAVRLDPRRLGEYIRQYRDVDLSTDREVIIYCDAPSEATSARLALALHQRGFQHVRPLAGGVRAWQGHGFPITSSVEVLPLAEHEAYVLHDLFQYSRHHTAELLKISAAAVEQLLDRARGHIRRGTVDAQLFSQAPYTSEISMEDFPPSPSVRLASTPE